MSPVKLIGPLLKMLLEARFPGGVKELQGLWDAHAGLHRSTVHQWTKGSLPQSRDDMLRRCGLLDIDPFCLVLPDGGDASDAVNQLIYAFQNDHWKPALSFIKDFMGRRSEWPPRQIATTAFGRPWTTVDVEHQAGDRKNYYAMLELGSDLQDDETRPQTYHFAFRHPTLFGKRWLQYGFVARRGRAVRLLHINGLTHDSDVQAAGVPTRVETFFGPGKAIFRVASLHPFRLKLVEAGNDDVPRVRLTG